MIMLRVIWPSVIWQSVVAPTVVRSIFVQYMVFSLEIVNIRLSSILGDIFQKLFFSFQKIQIFELKTADSGPGHRLGTL